MFPHFVQGMKHVTGLPPTTTNGANTGDYINIKYAHRIWIKWTFTNAAAHATTCGVNDTATTAAGAGAAAMTATQKIWSNLDTGTNDTLVARTDAATYAVDAGVTNKVVWMEIDPVTLAAGTAYIAATTTDSTEATNFVCIDYFIAPARYQQATPPTAVV